MQNNPIAIIGVSCLFPKANSLDELWKNVIEQNDCLTNASIKDWDIEPVNMLSTTNTDRVVSIRGGYIMDDLIHQSPEYLALNCDPSLDKLFHWVVYTAQAAILDAKIEKERLALTKCGLILGNLSFPTRSFNQFTEQILLAKQSEFFANLLKTKINPMNRFMSGLPAQFAAKQLNIKGDAFAIDAACASGLYAIKLACDRLQNHTADVMLAGAVNASDDLFIHMGFSALQALSPTGQSKPFHKEADGLVPGQGAGFIVLKRLEDALRDKDMIYAIIRGIGLSNDGKSKGFLMPDINGQIRAMKRTYYLSGLSPEQIDYIECHATGTQVGDKIELSSMSEVFTTKEEIHLSTLKGNIGHTITASTLGALFKVIGAFKHNCLPPAMICGSPSDYLTKSPFYLIENAMSWPNSHRPRRAAINGFGFGGCNAHAVIEAYEDQNLNEQFYIRKTINEPVAITGISIITSEHVDKEKYFHAFIQQAPAQKKNPLLSEVELSYSQAHFPPHDLKNSEGQQLMILKSVNDALNDFSVNPNDLPQTSAVYIGMQCDADICKYSLRWRLDKILNDQQNNLNQEIISNLKDQIIPALTLAHVIGSMPNIVANRINQQYDCQCPGYSYSGEEMSGIYAFKQAINELQNDEISTAIVGAVNMGADPVHLEALQSVDSKTTSHGSDVAVVLILERLSDAQRANHKIYAIITDDKHSDAHSFNEELINKIIGNSYCANGLLQIATASLCCYYGALPETSTHFPMPWPQTQGRRAMHVHCKTPSGQHAQIHLENYATAIQVPYQIQQLPKIYLYHANDLNLLVNKTVFPDTATLAVVAENSQQLQLCLKNVLDLLKSQPLKLELPTQGIFFQLTPLKGQIASVFTAAHTTYPNMGRDIILTYPHLMDTFNQQVPFQGNILSYLYQKIPQFNLSFLDELIAYSYLSQFHYLLLEHILKIKPEAMIGYCSGETNALFASGAWTDMHQMLQEIEQSEIYTRHLAGAYSVLQNPNPSWYVYRVLASVEELKKLLHEYTHCYLTIINGDNDCVVAGSSPQITQLIQHFPPESVTSMKYNMVIHCELVKKISSLWRSVHHRKTTGNIKQRHYSNARGAFYYPDDESAADALLNQATQMVHFPKLIQKAWEDGVRIFIEHGPRNLCTSLIQKILQDKPHSTISFDNSHVSSSSQFANVTALLLSHNIKINYPNIIAAHPIRKEVNSSIENNSYPLHWPIFELNLTPKTHTNYQTMPEETSPQLVEYLNYFYMKRLHALDTYVNSIKQITTSLKERDSYKLTDAKNKPLFSRADLITHASGHVSSLFGNLFAAQDHYPLQVRMPEPPLLLADRVIKLTGEPASMGLGSIETETDISADAWYLFRNHMPAGIMIEAGQADLMLISWLGIDLLNQGTRVYRLLGCELTYYEGLPETGDTLQYKIEVDSHAQDGDLRLFSFIMTALLKIK